MRRAALFGIMLLLSGCAYSAWWKPPFTAGGNPHAPTGDSENLRRVMGQDVEVKPLTPEPGDVWPGAVQALPTLQDVEQQGNLQPGQEQPVLGSPLQRGTEVPSLPPEVTRGSSTPPASALPGLPPLPKQVPAPPTAGPAQPPARSPAGQVVTTPSGPGVINGGTQGYQTMTLPGGGTAIVVPNGNGTSTVISPNGKIETIPTPR